MKYLCVWRDNCGVLQSTEFSAGGDREALSGLIERCRGQYAVPEGVTFSDPLLVIPEMLIREDFSRSSLGIVPSSNGMGIVGAYISGAETEVSSDS